MCVCVSKNECMCVLCVYVYMQTCKHASIITNGTGVPDGKPRLPTYNIILHHHTYLHK